MVSVRVFQKEDQEQAIEIFSAGLLQYATETSVVRFMEHSFLKRSLGTDMQDINAHFVLSSGKRNFWVAEFENKVVGIVAGAVSEDDSSVELCRMSVAAASRGMGAGGMLVRTLLNWASGFPSVSKVKLGTLNVKVAAIRLYQRFGFELVSSRSLGQDFFDSNGMDGAIVGDEVLEIRTYELVLRSNGAVEGEQQTEDPSAAWFSAPQTT